MPADSDATSRPGDRADVSLALAVETPENIVLTYQLAGPAARCGAFLLDLMIIVVATIVVRVVVWLMVAVLPGVAMGFWLLMLFLLEWAYFLLCEGLFRGKTVGKAAMGIRVIHEHGHPLTFWGATLRNLLRVVDSPPLLIFVTATVESPEIWKFVPVCGPALVAMLLSSKLQRIGDMAAGTVVISERFARLPREPIIFSRIRPLERSEIGRWQPDHRTLAAIDDFLSRRHVLSHNRGHELSAELARELARKLEFRGDPYQLRDYPMSFLARVYVTFARREDEDEETWQPPPPVQPTRPRPSRRSRRGATL